MTWPPLSIHDRDPATRRSRVEFYFVPSTKNEIEAISLRVFYRDENYRADTNNKKKLGEESGCHRDIIPM